MKHTIIDLQGDDKKAFERSKRNLELVKSRLTESDLEIMNKDAPPFATPYSLYPGHPVTEFIEELVKVLYYVEAMKLRGITGEALEAYCELRNEGKIKYFLLLHNETQKYVKNAEKDPLTFYLQGETIIQAVTLQDIKTFTKEYEARLRAEVHNYKVQVQCIKRILESTDTTMTEAQRVEYEEIVRSYKEYDVAEFMYFSLDRAKTMQEKRAAIANGIMRLIWPYNTFFTYYTGTEIEETPIYQGLQKKYIEQIAKLLEEETKAHVSASNKDLQKAAKKVVKIEKAQDHGESQEDGFTKTYRSEVTAAFMRTNPRKIEKDEVLAKTSYAYVDDFKFKFSEIAKPNLGPATKKVLMKAIQGLGVANSYKRNGGKEINTKVVFPFDEYARENGLDIDIHPEAQDQEAEVKRVSKVKNDFQKKVSKALATINALQIIRTNGGVEITDKKKRAREVRNIIGDGYSARQDEIMIDFAPTFAAHMLESAMTQLYVGYLLIDEKKTPSAVGMAEALSSHYYNYNNRAKDTYNILSLDSILKYTVLPTIDDLKKIKKSSQWADRVKEPLENAFDELMRVGILIDWEYCRAKKKKLTDDESEAIIDGSYTDYTKLYVKFTLREPANYEQGYKANTAKRVENKKKADNKKKRQQRKIENAKAKAIAEKELKENN